MRKIANSWSLYMRYLRRLITTLVIVAFSQLAYAGMLKQPVDAPEFMQISNWINSKPLKMSEQRSNVVLVEFWTYECINCFHAMPYTKEWYKKYKDKGLVVVGVHTPEYPEEYAPENVVKAINKFDIQFPVAQDNQYATWKVYGNQFWPALYLIDKKGKIVYRHFGEGNYQETESVIRKLLAEKS